MSLRVTKNPTGNTKLTGGSLLFYATYRAVGYSCPTTCTLLNNGCYAQSGNVAIHQRDAVSEDDGTVYLAALERMPHGALMRLHVSGDVMTNEGRNGSMTVDVAYLDAIIEGAKRRPDMTFYGYTHAWRLIDRARFSFPANLTLNASCDTQSDVDEARALGWDTTTVVPWDTQGKRFGATVVCPNQTVGLTCDKCKLCFKSNRPLTVAFRAHGVSAKRISQNMELPMAS